MLCYKFDLLILSIYVCVYMHAPINTEIPLYPLVFGKPSLQPSKKLGSSERRERGQGWEQKLLQAKLRLNNLHAGEKKKKTPLQYLN